MLEAVLNYLGSLPKELVIVIVAALPIAELRGAIPLGLYWGLPLAKVFWLAVLGNLLPVVPIIFFLEPLSRWFSQSKLGAKFFQWLFKRAQQKSELIQKYEAIGLSLFVAVPLPVTGAWTGSVIATLFRIKLRYALPAIFLGVVCAGIIVSVLCFLGILTYQAVGAL